MKMRLALLLTLGLAGVAAADDWPVFRGPHRNGISEEKGWAPWKGAPRILWKTEVGLGFSSMTVVADRLYTMGHNGDLENGQSTIYCLDVKTGKPVWTHVFPSDRNKHFYDGGTTSTPTVDGDHVYVLDRWGSVYCLVSKDGTLVWKKDLKSATGARQAEWGFTGCPVVDGDRLLLNMGNSGAAVDKKTGKLLWKSPGTHKAGYSTPFLFRLGDKSLAIFSSEKGYTALDPSNGRVAFEIHWITQYGCNNSDPILDGNNLLLATGYRKGSSLFDIASGSPKQVWTDGKVLAVQMNAGVLVDGHVYAVHGQAPNGRLQCVEFANGKMKWERKDVGNGALIASQGNLIVLSATGKLMIGPASPKEFTPVAEAQVVTGTCWTAPVLANGVIYCRSGSGQLAAINVKSAK